MRYPSDRPGDGSSEERVIERAYNQDGSVRWERAGIRTSQPPALPPGPVPSDPIWLEALAWVVSAFWGGVRILGEAAAGVVMFIGGLALGVFVIAATVALAAGVIVAGYGLGGWMDGPSGAATGAWIAVAVVVLTILGAANRRDE